jgi:hypothetical protein
LCGGLIHPVAGRCKHCKEDLTQFRAGRPQAASALPALNGKPAGTTNGTNGHIAAAAVPVMLTKQESQPILPPRTTARSMPAAGPRHSVWRSWPMMVIVLAVIAIVAATVIMVMPQGGKHKDGKMSAPPAPERMETNPLPDKSALDDPWGGAKVDPNPAQPAPTPKAPDPDDDDIWGGTAGGGGGVLGGGGAGGLGTAGANFMITALDHACKKLKSCPDVDQSSLTSVCEAVAMMPKPPKSATASCPSAQKCLDSIDHLSCSDANQASPHSVFTMFNDCMEATQC